MDEDVSVVPNEQYRLGVDVRITCHQPLFSSREKIIHEATWMNQRGPRIVIVQLNGPSAEQEASYYLQFSNHPHVIKTFGRVVSDDNLIMLLQERAPKPDLFELLQNDNQFKPSEEVLCTIFKQICDAMIFLSKANIVHADLACRNILVFQCDSNEPEKNLVKLTDFGLTRKTTDNSLLDSIVPKRYAAPELLQSQTRSNYSEKSEVYSTGVLMWEARSNGKIPYGSIENDDEVQRRKINDERLPRPAECGNQLWNIMNSCWNINPADRPSFRSLKRQLLDLISQLHLQSRQSALMQRKFFSPRPTLPLIQPNNSSKPYSGISSNRNQLPSQRTAHINPTSDYNDNGKCYFCSETFPSRNALANHLISCGSKTDECSTCHRRVQRTIFDYHIQNNCTDPDNNNNNTPVSSRNSSRATMVLNLNDISDHRTNQFVPNPPTRVLPPIQTPRSNPTVLPQHLNDSDAINRNFNQTSTQMRYHRRPKSRKNRGRLPSCTPACIPCEICGETVEMSDYQRHSQNCDQTDRNRVRMRAEEISRQTVRDLIPCEYCQRIFPGNRLSSHQTKCSQRSRRLAPIDHHNRRRDSPIVRNSAVRFSTTPVRRLSSQSPLIDRGDSSSSNDRPRHETNFRRQNLPPLRAHHDINYMNENFGRYYSQNQSNAYERSRRNQSRHTFRDDFLDENMLTPRYEHQSYYNREQIPPFDNPQMSNNFQNPDNRRNRISYNQQNRNWNDDDFSLRTDRTKYNQYERYNNEDNNYLRQQPKYPRKRSYLLEIK